MGIFFNSKASSAGPIKPKSLNIYKQIGGIEANKILKEMTVAERIKFKKTQTFGKLGVTQRSIKQLSEKLTQEYGRGSSQSKIMRDKFKSAAQKYYLDNSSQASKKQPIQNLTAEQLKRRAVNSSTGMQRDTSVLQSDTPYQRTKYSASGIMKSEAGNFANKKAATGFAQGGKLPNKPVDSLPKHTGGVRPLGL